MSNKHKTSQKKMGLLKCFDAKNNPLGFSTLEELLAKEEGSSRLLPESILPAEDGLYQLKYGTVFPVSHPSLSTQPSILPQSFGNLDIMEVLIANGRESEIPADATIIMATSFNDANCCAAVCKKVNGAWTITNSEGFTPDFTVVQYVQVNGGGYYGGGGGSGVKRDGTKDFEIAMNYDKLPQSKRYLAITADSANTENAKVRWSGNGTLFMSKNLLIWEEFNSDNSLAAGETLYLSGQVNTAGTITCNQPHSVSGNPMSLYHLYDFDKQALESSVFANLFYDNGYLINARNLSLPATTLANYCYQSMFYNCTSLTTAPALPATTLADGCYQSMFEGCTHLASITCLATNISASVCTTNWVKNVAASGTFTKAASMSSWTTGVNGIPSGWTVQDAS